MATFVIFSNTVDGEVYSTDASYSTARAGSGSKTTRTAYSLIGQYLFSGSYYVHETFLSFDTSSVTGTPTSATLSVKNRSDVTAQDFTVNARAYDWGASLTTADFVAGASLSGNPLRASYATSGITTGYLDFTSESTFKDNLSNPVRLLLSSSRTESGTTPTTDEYWSIWPADATGTTDDPKLTIVTTTDTPVSASDTASLSDTATAANVIGGASGSLTVYSQSGDGFVRNNGSSAWATLRAASTGTVKNDTSAATNFAYAEGTTADKYIDRGFLAFAVPAGAVVTSAQITLTANAAALTGAGGAICLVEGSQASTSALATTDFGSVGSTELASRINFSSWVWGTNTFTLNAAGLAVLNAAAGGYAKFALRTSFDLDNSAPGDTLYSGATGYYSEQSGTSDDPKLAITYTTVSEVFTVSDSGSQADPSLVTKSASDTATVTDTASPWNLITPTSGGWSQSAWTARSGYSAASIIKDGGGTRGAAYPMGVQLPNGNLRVWYGDWPGSAAYKTSTDGGATWSAETQLDFWGGTVPALTTGTGGGLVNVRRSRDGTKLHAAVNYQHWTGDLSTYPNGTGWDIYYTSYYAYSTDGTTWSTPVAIPQSRLSFLAMDVVELPNGDILITGEELNRGSGAYFRNAGPLQTNCYRSTDGGVSFAYHSTLADESVLAYRAFEPNHDVVDDGSTYGVIVCSTAKYPSNTGIYDRQIRTSTDGGATWSSPQQIATTANRGGVCVTPDGDVILAHSNSGGTDSTWYVSRDKGVTWTSMGDILTGTSQPADSGSGGYVANKWITPFVISTAGTTPNLAMVWGSGYDDAHGSSFFRTFTRGATAAPVISSGTGSDTATVSDSATVTIGVGAITKTASDAFNVTDTSGGLAVTYWLSSGETVVVADAATSPNTTIVGLSASDVFYVSDASGTGVPSTNRRPYWWLHRKRVSL